MHGLTRVRPHSLCYSAGDIIFALRFRAHLFSLDFGKQEFLYEHISVFVCGWCNRYNILIEKGESFLKNIEMSVEGNKLIIMVDLDQEFGLSSSGKSITVASTEGNVSVPGHEEIKIGLNIYRPKPKG